MAIKPLTTQELEDMHGVFREQFSYASRRLLDWQETSRYTEATKTTDKQRLVDSYDVAAPIVSVMATTAQAMMTIESELTERAKAEEQAQKKNKQIKKEM